MQLFHHYVAAPMDKALRSEQEDPQAAQGGYRRMILPQPMSLLGTGQPDTETELMAQLGPDTVFMMGDNPALTKMPEKPKLLDFFRHRFTPFTRNHLLQSANVALQSGMEEKVVLACLLHDIANGALRIRRNKLGSPKSSSLAIFRR
jgi:hypothetical protein